MQASALERAEKEQAAEQAAEAERTAAESASAAAEPAQDDVEALAQGLSLFLRDVLMATSRGFFSAVEQAGINFTQMKCLHLLGEAEEPLSVGALSETLGLSVPAVSRAVDGLVQRGEVKRTEDRRDRRSKLLTVSARGRRTFERLMALRFAGIKSYLDGLSEEEREALARGIAPLVRRLEET